MTINERAYEKLAALGLTRNGKPTPLGLAALRQLHEDLTAVLSGAHDDNTLSNCRVDLGDHDCCHACDNVGFALLGFAESFSNAEGLRSYLTDGEPQLAATTGDPAPSLS